VRWQLVVETSAHTTEIPIERRKFLIGAGDTAIGASALVGSGAFTSVDANRSLNVTTEDDANALLELEAMDTPNGNTYVDDSNGAISIDISDDQADGVNDDALTVVRDLFRVTNNGSQSVYVWAEGLPEGIRMFHAADEGFQNPGTGAGENQGAFSDSSNLDPDDPANDSDGSPEAAPRLGSGQTLDNIGLLVDTQDSEVNLEDDIVIKAVAESEV
jgi:hypothetical protein